jgi:hypothetical protein
MNRNFARSRFRRGRRGRRAVLYLTAISAALLLVLSGQYFAVAATAAAGSVRQAAQPASQPQGASAVKATSTAKATSGTKTKTLNARGQGIHRAAHPPIVCGA